MDALLKDLRHGIRMLLRTPLLSGVSTLTIALGVGSVTFAFSVMYSTLFRGLPVRDSDRLVLVMETAPSRGIDRSGIPLHDLLDLREAQTSLESLEGFYSGTVNLAGDEGPPERVQGGFVTPGTLGMLGVPPLLGRTFVEGEEGPEAPHVIVLGHDVWRTRYGADPAVVGRTVRVNGVATEIVGVMPEGFAFPMQEDVWVPLRLDPTTLGRREGTHLQGAGYLRPGVTLEAANAELAAIARRIEAAWPVENEGMTVRLDPYVEAYTPVEVSRMVTLLMAMVLGVLLVACANVANVLLARAVVREREVAVRSALGANRWRVVRQLLTEAVVLGVLGGLGGVLLAHLSLNLLDWSVRDLNRPYWIVFVVDRPVLLFTALTTLLAAVAAGTWPALRASGADIGNVLRDESRGSSSLRVGRFTSALVVGELAISCGLMIGAGLMVSALFDLNRVDLGFDPEGVMTARLGLFESDYPDAAARGRFFTDLLEELRAETGVEAAALATSLPGTGQGRTRIAVEGVTYPTEDDRPRAGVSSVTGGFFQAAGVPVLEGREFSLAESEAGGEPVAVVSRGFVDRHMGGGPALERRIQLATDGPWLRVVGVVADVHPGMNDFGGSGDLSRDAVYTPLPTVDPRFVSVMVRAAGPAEGMAGAIQRAVSATDPNLPLYWVRTLQAAIDETTAFHRIFSGLFAIFGGAALFLAVVGLYGVIDFSVSSRLREMGVRRAMGAGSPAIVGLVVGKVVAQVALGTAFGLALGAALAVPLSATLYGVTAWSLPVYGGTLAILGVTALAAALVPATRAARVDPMIALRV